MDTFLLLAPTIIKIELLIIFACVVNEWLETLKQEMLAKQERDWEERLRYREAVAYYRTLKQEQGQ